MKFQTGWRKAGVVRRVIVLGLCFALFALQPTLGGAAIMTRTYSETSVSVDAPLVEFYEYGGGTTSTWTDTADFDAGTYTAANGTDLAGAVVLNRIGPPGVAAPDPAISWWNTDWTNRRCYEIDHTAAGAATVTEYQVRIEFPIAALAADGFLQADLGDLRAVGTDGETSLPVWPDDTIADTVWVQVDRIEAAATSSFCLYFGYGNGTATSPANHTEAAVFSYTSAKDIYYTVSEVFSSPGTPINVVSYVDGNTVSRSDGTDITLATAGDLGTFDALGTDASSAFGVLGPISATGVGDGADTLVPISFAGTSFISPINRDGQQFSFLAPFGDAEVDLYAGAALVSSFTLTGGTPYTHIADDIGATSVAVIESDIPILVTHRTDADGDAVALYPAAADVYYAVRSGELLIGYGTDTTTVAITGSDGVSSSVSGNRGELSTVAGGAPQGGGSDDGLMLTADQPIAVVTHEDGDGVESVTVWPALENGSVYWIPVDSQYIAFACPTAASADVAITVAPPTTASRAVTCSGGPEVAWAVDTADLAVAASGIRVSTDNGSPFHAYYDDLAGDDQIALLGMKQGRQYTWPEPVVVEGTDEGLYEQSGSWVSATVDTGAGTNVFGLVSMGGATPTATTLRIQIATAAVGIPTAFVGPDGTAGSYYELTSLPASAPFSHDGDRFVRVRAELATTDPAAESPRLDLVSIDAHLPALDRSLSGTPSIALSTTIDPASTSSYLLRVKTSNAAIIGSTATAVYRGGSNFANLATETVRFVNDELGVDSVQQSNTLPIDPPLTFQQGQPHSVVLDHAAVGSGTTTVLFAWQLDFAGGGSIFFETDFEVEVTAP